MAIIKVLTIIGFLSLPLVAEPHVDYPELRKLKATYSKLPADVQRDIKKILFSFDQAKKLPDKYISKYEACRLKWKSKFCRSKKERCNLRQIAHRKSIGGDKFVNTANLPGGPYFVADLGNLKPNDCRGPFRLIYRADFNRIYFSPDHYATLFPMR